MLDVLIWNKYSRIIHLLASRLGISDKEAMELFYHSRVYQVLSAPDSLLVTMSDQYIADELQEEWKERKSPHESH